MPRYQLGRMFIYLDGDALDPTDLACGYFCPTSTYTIQLTHQELSECPASRATYNAYGCGKFTNGMAANKHSEYCFNITSARKIQVMSYLVESA